jgi:hypothetical protein
MQQLSRWIEITFVLLILYLVLANSGAFATVTSSLSSSYVGAVKVLQGR